MRPAVWGLKLLPPRSPERPPAPVAPDAEPPVPEWLRTRKPSRRRLPSLRVRRPHLPLPNPAHWTRYTWGLAAVLVLGLLARMPALWALPFDTPSGPQAATAAFVRRLTATGGDLKAAMPWIGPMPTAPTAGLPLYAWLAALLGAWGDGQPWIGRAVSVLAALLATALLFVVVRRLAGGRAALYAALFQTIAPAGLYYGRAYLPDPLGWAAACGALAATLRWRDSVLAERPHVRRWFVVAAATGALAVLVAPANLALLLPLLYLAWPRRWTAGSGQQAAGSGQQAAGSGPSANGNGHAAAVYEWPAPPRGSHPAPAIQDSRSKIRNERFLAYGFVALVAVPLLLWWGLMRVAGATATLDPAFGGGGVDAVWDAMREGAFWSLLVSNLVNSVLTFAGLLVLLAGLGRPARQPWPWVFHLWVLGGLVVVLANAPRLAADDATLAPWLPALAALIGLGANWIATLPALAAAALRGQEEAPADLDADRADGLPTDEPDPEHLRENGRPLHGAVRRANRAPGLADSRERSWPGLRTALLRLGNSIAILLLLAVFVGGANALVRRYEFDPASMQYASAGARALTTDPGKAGGRLVVAGPGAPEMFYTTQLTGWAVPEDSFSHKGLDDLKTQGAMMLLSADQGWLGHHGDYPGLLAAYRVALLDQNFIVFDLRLPPATTDSLYFLETGKTLRGAFRDYWEHHGGVDQFGFPLTDELTEASPTDGQKRTVQYFERAVFELHEDKKNTPYLVQLAPVGRWVLDAHAKQAESLGAHLVGIDPVPAAPDTPTYHFFKETGHSVKGEFLKFWQKHGGVALLGYPVSEELNEISPADGKVHIVQYFERARLEWHQEAAGKPQQVQLGLLGKEWMETARR